MTRPSVPASAASPPALAAPSRGLWGQFAQRHLFDYNPSATRRWLALAACGLLALGWSLASLSQLGWQALAQVQLGIAFVALAACFPVHVPRTKYSIGVADVFVFALLALHGAPAAIVAGFAEGLVGALRTSKRLSSRVSSPCAAALGMAACGWVHDLSLRYLLGIGMHPGVAELAAVSAGALPYFTFSTLPLLAVMAAKTGQRLSLRDWIQNYSWLAAIFLMSAVVAGVLAINARQFGPVVIVLAAVVIFYYPNPTDYGHSEKQPFASAF